MHEDITNAYKNLVTRSKGKISLGDLGLNKIINTNYLTG
jgi:hypothetical protein